jgi:L-asparaginase
MQIKVFVTGGTFDKEYNELDGTLYFKETHLPEMLERGRCRIDLDVETLMLVDSLQITDADRDMIRDSCQTSPFDRIVVTHGTDTMEETARVLGQAITNKTVVLVGAMIPYKFGSSDGLFNLGSALAFAQSLPHGVYVAMNGRYFTWNNVTKDRVTGEFQQKR